MSHILKWSHQRRLIPISTVVLSLLSGRETYRTVGLPAAARKFLSGLIARRLTCFLRQCQRNIPVTIVRSKSSSIVVQPALYSDIVRTRRTHPLWLKGNLSIANTAPSLPEPYRVVIYAREQSVTPPSYSAGLSFRRLDSASWTTTHNLRYTISRSFPAVPAVASVPAPPACRTRRFNDSGGAGLSWLSAAAVMSSRLAYTSTRSCRDR